MVKDTIVEVKQIGADINWEIAKRKHTNMNPYWRKYTSVVTSIGLIKCAAGIIIRKAAKGDRDTSMREAVISGSKYNGSIMSNNYRRAVAIRIIVRSTIGR